MSGKNHLFIGGSLNGKTVLVPDGLTMYREPIPTPIRELREAWGGECIPQARVRCEVYLSQWALFRGNYETVFVFGPMSELEWAREYMRIRSGWSDATISGFIEAMVPTTRREEGSCVNSMMDSADRNPAGALARILAKAMRHFKK